MKSYKKAQFLNNLVFNSLAALTSCLFCSYPIWFPFIKHFYYVSLPNVFCFFFNPKCLFIVGNIIVIILFTESKLAGSYPATEIYDEYGERTRSLQGNFIIEEKEKEGSLEMNVIEEIENNDEEEEDEQVEEKMDNDDYGCGDGGGGDDVEEEEEEEREEEEEAGLPAEELNRRVEDFIAKVNRQRWLEANASLLEFEE